LAKLPKRFPVIDERTGLSASGIEGGPSLRTTRRRPATCPGGAQADFKNIRLSTKASCFHSKDVGLTIDEFFELQLIRQLIEISHERGGDRDSSGGVFGTPAMALLAWQPNAVIARHAFTITDVAD
jgi:hypothetical protein